ncbi:TIGR01777 family oxidoreductase [Penaeicola halotolerans]|uniref:TIGR01777 family oxidoreductase n=1 Tax=Penaeicola halotolerans TaxID=2793196 RepID=UPI001CF8D537|nr:TIGR01777 family oxidoreductase [Penaeicola halotolerans]
MDKNMRILITGGTGLVGTVLTKLLIDKGHEVAHLSRSKADGLIKTFTWDITKRQIDQEGIEWADAIIHLAGAGVAEKRWSVDRKAEILHSRTHSTQLLREAIDRATNRPTIFVSASAIGIYGADTGTSLLDESAPAGSDFLAQVVQAWEHEVTQIETLGLRTVMVRIGIVLAKEGGALPQMLQPPVAAPLGSGDQYMSWIHIQDLAELFLFALTHEISGAFNAVAPHPETNRDLTQKAAKAKGKFFLGISVPGFLLKLILGEMAQIVLGGSKLSAQKITAAGFQFKYPRVEDALRDIFSK